MVESNDHVCLLLKLQKKVRRFSLLLCVGPYTPSHDKKDIALCTRQHRLSPFSLKWTTNRGNEYINVIYKDVTVRKAISTDSL